MRHEFGVTSPGFFDSLGRCLSKRAKYGLRALIYLARHQGEGPIQIRDISEKLKIPRKFLEAILLDLRRRRLCSQAGRARSAASSMERAPDNITSRQDHSLYRRTARCGTVRQPDRLRARATIVRMKKRAPSVAS